MTVRDRIMDKYWIEFLESDEFKDCHNRYEYATPLEATFWGWFKNRAEKSTLKPLAEYL